MHHGHWHQSESKQSELRAMLMVAIRATAWQPATQILRMSLTVDVAAVPNQAHLDELGPWANNLGLIVVADDLKSSVGGCVHTQGIRESRSMNVSSLIKIII